MLGITQIHQNLSLHLEVQLTFWLQHGVPKMLDINKKTPFLGIQCPGYTYMIKTLSAPANCILQPCTTAEHLAGVTTCKLS